MIKKFESSSEYAGLVSELTASFSIPLYIAIEAVKKLIPLFAYSELDQISRDILKALSVCDKLSVSKITRRVGKLRDSASRRVIRERLRKLEERRIVVNIGSNKRPLYILGKCLS